MERVEATAAVVYRMVLAIRELVAPVPRAAPMEYAVLHVAGVPAPRTVQMVLPDAVPEQLAARMAIVAQVAPPPAPLTETMGAPRAVADYHAAPMAIAAPFVLRRRARRLALEIRTPVAKASFVVPMGTVAHRELVLFKAPFWTSS